MVSAPSSPPRAGSLRLAPLAALLFAVAFVWSACWTYLPLRGRNEPIPNLPALAEAGLAAGTIPIADFLIREGEWDWARGGRFHVLPGGKSSLAPRELAPDSSAVAAANEHGARPEWTSAGQAAGFELCAAAAWCADWWTLRLGNAPRSHENWLTGRLELGLPPLGLAALYETRRMEDRAGHPVGNPDPVLRRRTPASLEAVARLMASTADAVSSTGTLTLRWEEAGWPNGAPDLQFGEFAMAGPARTVFSGTPDARTARQAEEALADAIRLNGMALAGLAEGAWQDGAGGAWHIRRAAVVIGDYTFNGRRLFLLRAPLGFKTEDRNSSYPYAMAPAEALCGAVVFPHPMRAEWRRSDDEATELRVFACDGRPLELNVPRDLRLAFDARIESAGAGVYRILPTVSAWRSPLRLEIVVPGHMPADGRPISLSL